MNIDLVRYRPLRAGAAAGHYTVPAGILEDFEVLDRLEGYVNERTERTAPAAREALADEIIAAAKAGKPLPSGAGYMKAEDADRAADARSVLLAELLDRRAEALVTRCAASARAVLLDHLRPALTEVLDEARIPADLVQPFGTDTKNFLSAPDDVRAALLVLTDLAERYSAIRKARGIFRDHLKPEYDTDGSFSEFRSLHIAAPYYRQPNAARPWPEDAVGRFVWGITSGAEPWMPTPEEQDARWMEVYGAAAKTRAAYAASARANSARTAELAR